MVLSNLTIYLDKILKWSVLVSEKKEEIGPENYRTGTLLNKLNIAHKLETNQSKYSIDEIDGYFFGKIQLDDQQKLLIIHKAVTLINAMLELQSNNTTLKEKIKKDIESEVFANLALNIYARLVHFYGRRYTRHLFNHVKKFQKI